MKQLFAFVGLTLLVCEVVNSIPVKCKDNIKCKQWNKKGFCKSHAFAVYTKITTCPVECGYCRRATQKTTKRHEHTTTASNLTTTTVRPTVDNEAPYDVFKNSLNQALDPCDDFFAFTCGTYQTNHKDQQESSRFIDVGVEIQNKIAALLFNTTEQSKLPAIQKMFAYKDTCMDVTKLNAGIGGVRTQELLDHITELKEMPMLTNPWPVAPATFDLTFMLYAASKFYLGHSEPFFRTSVEKFPDGSYQFVMFPGDLMMKEEKYYTEADADSAQKRQDFKDYLFEIVSFVADDKPGPAQPPASIKRAIDAVFDLETSLARLFQQAGPPPNELLQIIARLENKTIQEVKDLVTKLDLSILFTSDPSSPDADSFNPLYPPEVQQHLQLTSRIFVYNSTLFKQIGDLINATRNEVLANYVILRMICQSVPYLDTRFTEAGNRIAQKLDGSTHVSTRAQDCFDKVNKNFGMSVDYVFIEKYFNLELSNKVDQLIENIRWGLKQMMTEDQWLSSATRTKALDKLEKMRKFIGGPLMTIDERQLERYYGRVQFEASDSYLAMSIKIMLAARWRNIIQLVIPDYDQFTQDGLRATEVNAFNMFNFNTVVIPVGITFLANFSMANSSVYGALGFELQLYNVLVLFMGHEFSHGFDTKGYNYNNEGNYDDWWDASTKQEFQNRAQCIERQYSNIDIPDTNLKVDGQNTLAENIADNAGIRAAFRAYQHFLSLNNDTHVPGYKNYTNEQIFFISASVAFCNWQQPSVRAIYRDEHAPNFARLNTAMANFPEFAKAFKCKAGSKMNPTNRCEVW